MRGVGAEVGFGMKQLRGLGGIRAHSGRGPFDCTTLLHIIRRRRYRPCNKGPGDA